MIIIIIITIIIQRAKLIENFNKDEAILFKKIFLNSNFLKMFNCLRTQLKMNIYQNFKLNKIVQLKKTRCQNV